jgi:hypothetical protein
VTWVSTKELASMIRKCFVNFDRIERFGLMVLRVSFAMKNLDKSSAIEKINAILGLKRSFQIQKTKFLQELVSTTKTEEGLWEAGKA